MIFIDDLTPAAFELVTSPAVAGLTCNPTIVKRDRPGWGFAETLAALSDLPGLHFMQGHLTTTDWISTLESAADKDPTLTDRLIIKLPWEPLQAAPIAERLIQMDFGVCATGVYTSEQFYTALCTGCEYVAVYVDRMKRAEIDPWERISDMLTIADYHEEAPTILAASIKSVNDANLLLRLGPVDLTLPLTVAQDFLKGSFPHGDCLVFEKDFSN